MRRQPEDTVLHQVVRQHLETFLAEARRRGGGGGLPRFVERELREFLTCGLLPRGFARFRCRRCDREILVAFSCKGRFCPSCCGRRMCELAAHLVDGVFGDLPVRQWVLTLPHRLRYALAYDHRLCRAVLGVFVRAVLSSERRRAGVHRARGRGGAVTAIQRCGSALNVNVHFHTVAAQGAFEEQADGSRRFEKEFDRGRTSARHWKRSELAGDSRRIGAYRPVFRGQRGPLRPGLPTLRALVLQVPAKEKDQKLIAEMLAEITTRLDQLDGRLPAGPYALGAQFTLADCAAASPVLTTLPGVGGCPGCCRSRSNTIGSSLELRE